MPNIPNLRFRGFNFGAGSFFIVSLNPNSNFAIFNFAWKGVDRAHRCVDPPLPRPIHLTPCLYKFSPYPNPKFRVFKFGAGRSKENWLIRILISAYLYLAGGWNKSANRNYFNPNIKNPLYTNTNTTHIIYQFADPAECQIPGASLLRLRSSESPSRRLVEDPPPPPT